MNGVNYAYTYDGNGNILAANVGGTAHTYTYGNSVWKDLLTAYDGQAITYDDIGNPLAYLNGMTFTWQNGRELATMTKNGVTTTYVYNADGGRYTKTVGDTVTQYYYVGGKLYAETTGNNTLVYLYDETGTPYAFTLNGTKYYYEYNLMGDVIGLFDTTGTRVVRYYYTPYGDLASMVDNTTAGVGSINPIRYRGYYYDAETGFYYCGSRYYNPEIGRWINADGELAGIGGDVLGYNLFAYCGNNPINMSDPTGNWPKWVSGALNIISGVTQVIAGAALGATVGWTGIGAVAAGFLVVNGSAAFLQGAAEITNDVFDTKIPETNLVQGTFTQVGKLLGGETGEKIGNGIYEAANTAATVYSIFGGSSTMLEKTARTLGKHAEISKVETYIFSKPSPFFNEYTVSGAYTITKTVFLPKVWFRIANGIGAATDLTISIYKWCKEDS